MTTYKWGDVLLVAFPRTDATGTSKRPAVALYDEGDEDVMVARITTQSARCRSDLTLTDWETAGLLAPSVVRLGKIATIKKSLVSRRLGALTLTDQERLKSQWQALFT